MTIEYPESVLHVFGDRIFAGNADTLRSGIEPLFANGRPHTIVFDLARVKLCDSCGLRLFINLQRLATDRKKAMILFRPDAIFRDLLETTRLTQFFKVVDTLDPVLAAQLDL